MDNEPIFPVSPSKAEFANKRVLPQLSRPMHVPTMGTNDLTQAIIKYIRAQGGYAVRINCFGMYDPKTKSWRKSTTERGTADIHACVNGWHLSIEVKVGSDRQRSHQTRAEEQIKNAGGLYAIISSFEEFHAWFQLCKTPTRS